MVPGNDPEHQPSCLCHPARSRGVARTRLGGAHQGNDVALKSHRSLHPKHLVLALCRAAGSRAGDGGPYGPAGADPHQPPGPGGPGPGPTKSTSGSETIASASPKMMLISLRIVSSSCNESRPVPDDIISTIFAMFSWKGTELSRSGRNRSPTPSESAGSAGFQPARGQSVACRNVLDRAGSADAVLISIRMFS